MIVSCPECGARYRLADDAIPPEGRAMRCASCSHRWFEAGPEVALDQPAPAPPEPEAIALPEPAWTPAPDEDDDPPRPARTVLKTLFALLLSAAFTAGAVLLWLPDLPPLDLARVPWLDRLVNPPAPPPSPLTVAFTAARQPVGDGRTLFILHGTLTNPTAAPQPVPILEGRLIEGVATIAYRWRIAAPVATLPAGRAVALDASAIGRGGERVAITLLP